MRLIPGILQAALLIVLTAVGPVRAQPPERAPDLGTGIRQVDEGDFEGALLTLDGVVRALTDKPGRERELTRAHLYLGMANVALGQDAAARTHFKSALRREPGLKLGADRNSPKVIAALEAAREDLQKEQGGPGKRRTSPLVLAAVGGAAVAAGIVVASGGDDPGADAATFTGARFGTPLIECPNASRSVPIPVTLLVEARNPTGRAVTIASVATVIVIVASPTTSEIGQATSRPTAAVPPVIPSGQSATVRLDTTILCDNDLGDPVRFNEWSGRITLTTSAGIFALDTADRLRINIP